MSSSSSSQIPESGSNPLRLKLVPVFLESDDFVGGLLNLLGERGVTRLVASPCSSNGDLAGDCLTGDCPGEVWSGATFSLRIVSDILTGDCLLGICML